MTLTLDPVLEGALQEYARQQGVAPETLAMNVLRERFLVSVSTLVPQDEWERAILSAGIDCGVSLPHEAFSSEGVYE